MNNRILEIRDACRKGFLKYTRKAFESIPDIEKPDILDLGCGTGVPTLEIAGLTDGKILAIDSDLESLNYLKHKIDMLNYSDRISVIHGSILEVKLPVQHFDIIIAEGVLHIIGLNKALKRFTGSLKTPGYFMIHDEDQLHYRKLSIIEKNNYRLLESFVMDEQTWWNDHYCCLEQAIIEYEKENAGDLPSTDIFRSDKAELEMYRKNPQRFRSRYYVLQKT